MKSPSKVRNTIVTIICLFAAGTLLFVPRVHADEVNIGDTRETVIEALGEPLGFFRTGGLEVLTYRLGQAELKDGRVVSTSVVTEAVFERRETARKQREAAEAKQRLEAREARTEAGTAELNRILNEDVLADKSPGAQLNHWRDFQRRYPDVDVSSQIRGAQSSVAAEKAKAAAIEARVVEEMRTPPMRMSSRKQRKFRRGRSQGALELRREQILAEIEAETAAK